MLAYIIRRVALLPLMWLAATLIIFIVMSFLGPYQRLSLYLRSDPEMIVSAKHLNDEQRQRIFEKYGLNDPFYVQYFNWLGQVFQGNFGWSKTAQKPVLDALVERLPATLELTLLSIGPLIFLAIWMGVKSAVYQNKFLDHVTRFVAITGYSLPSFVFAIFALVIFYGLLDWLPPGRLSLWAEHIVYSSEFIRYTGLNLVDSILNERWDIWWDAFKHLILPVVSLSYLSWAGLLRVTRSSMLETLQQDYVVTAHAKGLPEKKVIKKHARRNALIPVLTLSGFVIVGLLTGVFIIETVFNYRGVGFWAVDATLKFDVPAVIGITLFTATLIVLANLIIDILYTIFDPRVRYD
ncbi:ABC transporter permease [Candidatus Acetothermia bacterium]|nr:ABC transporter permease [Candidatus Acetothermia bacterium]MBI3644156.1 ABC transporter permease [Candidatus Acetothermia bacterium]